MQRERETQQEANQGEIQYTNKCVGCEQEQLSLVTYLERNTKPNQSTIRHQWVNSTEQTCSPPAFKHSTYCTEWVVLCLIIISRGQGDFPYCSIRQTVIPQRWIVSIVLLFYVAISASTQKFDTSQWNFVYIRAWFWSECSFQKYAVSFIWQNNMHRLCVHCASLLSPFISDGSLMSLLTRGCLSRVFGSDVRITMADMPGTQAEKSFIVPVWSRREIAEFKAAV